MSDARQIKAARALVNWSQRDLAAATGLSITTIRNLESGDMSLRHGTLKIIRHALEKSGIEFLDNDGVRRRNDVLKIYEGPNSCDVFFEDLLQTVREKGGEVVSAFQSTEDLIEVCAMKRGDLGRLKEITKYANVRCLLPSLLDAVLFSSSFQFREILRQHIGPTSYFVFGDKHALVTSEPNGTFRFVVFNSYRAVSDYRKYFIWLWDMAPPILAEVRNKDMRIVA